jgi:tetratricopeptide (TPR) repeat protein
LNVRFAPTLLWNGKILFSSRPFPHSLISSNSHLMSSRNKHATTPRRPVKPSAKAGSKARLWAFRVIALLVGPLLFFTILEIALRVAGEGHPTSFFLTEKVNGQESLVQNDRFSWRFFGQEMARTAFPFMVPKVKPPDTTRIFVFGESAAYGDPEPEFSMSRVLTALLEGRHPGQKFEVINTAMTAINSHVILPIARDCAPLQGDCWVIYMGNNEVVGPYGSGTVFGTRSPSLPVVRASIALRGSYTGQLLESWFHDFQTRAGEPGEWGGMAMFVRNHVSADDPRMATVYHSFERNLGDIIDLGLNAHATVIVSTIVRNLRDCGPFASDHKPGLSATDLAQWQQLYQSGVADQQSGKYDQAIASFRQADGLDNLYAETHFRLGQCLLDAGRDADAAKELNLACDDDTLRFRADSKINGIIRRVAVEDQQNSVRLADSDAVANQSSPHSLAGHELLLEHVHLNFEGNYLVARAIADQIEKSLPQSGVNPWPTADDCARRLGFNGFARRAADIDILGRLSAPPFTGQPDNRRQYQRLVQQVEQLQAGLTPDALRTAIAQTQASAQRHPDDWILWHNLAGLQMQSGQAAAAVESLRQVTRLIPFFADAWQALGQALASAKNYTDATAAFQTAMRLEPESVTSLNSLAEMHARAGQTEQAAQEFREVLRRKPDSGPAHLGLALVLDQTGHSDEANAEFDKAFRYREQTPAYLNTLGALALSKGWYDRAIESYTNSLRVLPADPDAEFNLGRSLEKVNRNAEAKSHYEKAISLRPDFVEAHFRLGLEQGQSGDWSNAAAEFNEVVRLKPDFVEARLNLGIALIQQHRDQEALGQFEEALRLDPNNPTALKYIGTLRAPHPAPSQP